MDEKSAAYNNSYDQQIIDDHKWCIDHLVGITISVSDKPCSDCQISDISYCDHCGL